MDLSQLKHRKLVFSSPPVVPKMASYNINVEGVIVNTTVVKSASLLDTYVRELRMLCESNRKAMIGVDVEWNPNSTTQRASILQLCIGTRCLIIQLRYLNIVPQSLNDFIADVGVSFVGVGITEDIGKLSLDYGLGCRSAIELGPLAARIYGKPENANYGLAELARVVVGLNVEKPTNLRCSNWDNDTLSNDQIKYATIDAYASYLIGEKLLG